MDRLAVRSGEHEPVGVGGAGFGELSSLLSSPPGEQVHDYAELLNTPGELFAGMIDMDNIAVVGHSYGGYTALAAAGARFDFVAYKTRCATLAADDPVSFFCAPISNESDMQSGKADTPTLVNARVDDRLAWQRPKAIICSVVLVVVLALCAQIWRALIRKSRVRQRGWTPKDVTLLAAGLLGGPVCLVLMLMVIGNTQASLAPLAMTLFYG